MLLKINIIKVDLYSKGADLLSYREQIEKWIVPKQYPKKNLSFALNS